jgi:hypothetical protein
MHIVYKNNILIDCLIKRTHIDFIGTPLPILFFRALPALLTRFMLLFHQDLKSSLRC